jgi:hypothetical protein
MIYQLISYADLFYRDKYIITHPYIMATKNNKYNKLITQEKVFHV